MCLIDQNYVPKNIKEDQYEDVKDDCQTDECAVLGKTGFILESF